MKKLREAISVFTARKPNSAVLVFIILLNVVLIFVAATVICLGDFEGIDNSMPFPLVLYNTMTMILDAGCISNLVADVGQADAAVLIICIVVIMLGMVTFTGAMIGYFTNVISGFIENSNAGVHRLRISDHTVILNWNTRASEIINDLLYCEKKQKVVVLTGSGKDAILKEIDERLTDTVNNENDQLREKLKDEKRSVAFLKYSRNKMKKSKVTYIVREGDIFSSMQLRDICVEQAKAIIILGTDRIASVCGLERTNLIENSRQGNPQIIKTLMQVADITSDEKSANDQKVIVEVPDEWTGGLVDKIIECKEVEGKCNIVPIRVNRVFGQLFSQFCIMPEINYAYRELFSNKGVSFYSVKDDSTDEKAFVKQFNKEHHHAIPLRIMNSDDGRYCYFSALEQNDITKKSNPVPSDYSVKLKPEYVMKKISVAILGHNSKIEDIMDGFENFNIEWPGLLELMVIDDADYLRKVTIIKNTKILFRAISSKQKFMTEIR